MRVLFYRDIESFGSSLLDSNSTEGGVTFAEARPHRSPKTKLTRVNKIG